MSDDGKKIHQEFDVNNKGILVRQDRIDCDPERNSIKFPDGKTARVVNMAAFGVAVETEFEVEENYQNCLFLVDGYTVSEVSLAKVRSHKMATGTFQTAFSILGNPLDIEAAISLKSLNELLKTTSESLKTDSELKESFRIKVYEIYAILTRIETQVNELNPNSFQHELNLVFNFEDRIATRVSEYMSEMLSPLYEDIRKTLVDIPKAQLNKYFDFFRRSVGRLMYQAPYAHRAFHKPRGYAGDFEMMNHVYKRELRGETLFAKCLQRYFVDEPAGRAVRNREVYIRRKIKDICDSNNDQRKIKILSVASGPSMEIQNLIADKDFDISRLEIHLLDQDVDALKHAQRKIKESALLANKTVNILLHNVSIKNVLLEGLSVKDLDLIYSAGLFDYFTDPVAIFAAKKLYESLAKDGTLVVGNFSINNPNQLGMGLIMDWNLIYRSEQKMEELFGNIGTGYKLEQEEQGINLFANITK